MKDLEGNPFEHDNDHPDKNREGFSEKRRQLMKGIVASALALLIPKAAPGQTAAKSLENFSLDLVSEVSEVRSEIKQYLINYLAEELEQDRKGREGMRVWSWQKDHLLLALGDVSMRKAHPLTEEMWHPTLGIYDVKHPGSNSYSLLRSGADLESRVDSKRPISVRKLAEYDLSHIDEGYVIEPRESEWHVLTTIELLRRGITPTLATKKGDAIQLEDLVKNCQEEFDFVFHQDRFSEEQMRTMKIESTCGGFHALHALTAYDVFRKNHARVQEHVDFTFNQIKSVLVDSQAKPSSSEEDSPAHKISHLVTPLTELPPSINLTPDQKQLVKEAVNFLVSFSRQAVTIKDESIGTLCHVLDVLNHLPAEWLR